MQNSQTLVELVKKFQSLMHRLNDNQESAPEVTRFLQRLLRTQGEVPPTTEFMTILKHEKPVLFHYMRYRTNRKSNLYILFQLETSYEAAKQKLTSILDKS